MPIFKDTPPASRSSAEICNAFLESGQECATIDLEEVKRGKETTYTSLYIYIKSHNLPLRVHQRRGEIILCRKNL